MKWVWLALKGKKDTQSLPGDPSALLSFNWASRWQSPIENGGPSLCSKKTMEDGSSYVSGPKNVIGMWVGHFKQNLANRHNEKKYSCVWVSVLYLSLKSEKSDATMSLFNFFLHLILKFKPFDKRFPFQNVIVGLPPCVGMCIHWIRIRYTVMLGG